MLLILDTFSQTTFLSLRQLKWILKIRIFIQILEIKLIWNGNFFLHSFCNKVLSIVKWIKFFQCKEELLVSFSSEILVKCIVDSRMIFKVNCYFRIFFFLYLAKFTKTCINKLKYYAANAKYIVTSLMQRKVKIIFQL